jgi:hypothetical protein
MSIKSRLFGKPWQNRDPDTRARAVAEGDDPELLAELGAIAEHDEDARVRLAALKRINTEPFWLDARLRESDAAIVDAADEFLVRAVMQRADPKLERERLAWFRRFESPEFDRRAAAHAPEPGLRREALARIESPGFLGDRIVEERDEALALSLIDRIDQRSTLERIEAKLRKTSKRRARAVQDRLKALMADAGEYDASAESTGRLLERAERLARGQFEGDRGEELQSIEAAWAGVESPDEAVQRRLTGALEIVRRSLQAPARRVTEQPTETPTTPPAANLELSKLVEHLESLESIERISPEEAGRLLGKFDRTWQGLEPAGEAETALRERALPVLRALQRRREAAGPAASSAESVEAAASARQHEETDWDSQLDPIADMLDAGEIAPAQAALREVRSRIDRLSGRKRPKAAAGRLGRLEGRLREMRDYEHWSNNQHRDALIERVEALAESDPHPDAVTEALKQARKEWQALENMEVLPGDKRRHAAPSGQWRRFQAACKQAFEQAEPFFQKRHEAQSGNLEQLERFLEQAGTLTTEENADLERLKQTQRAARAAIRRLDDLPPKTRGRSAARLRELMDRISARLDEGFEAIENRKRRLVREAEALSRETDLKAAIEQAKALQARWKEAGSGRRKIEQELWKAFRAPIDPLFEQLDEASREQREQQAAEQAELRALVEHAEQLAESEAAELDAAAGRLRALREEFEAGGQRARGLAERLDKAEARVRKRLDDRRAAERRAAGERRERWARSIQDAWQARTQGREPAASPDMDPAETDEILRTLSAVHESLSGSEFDDAHWQQRVSDNAEAARAVLIEMEFLSGLDSPPEDREARMNFQVERLAQRMGQGDRSPGLREELRSLRRRWYAALPLPEDRFETMAKRFHKCQNVLESMTGTE